MSLNVNTEFNFSLKPDYLLMDNSDFSFKKFLKQEKNNLMKLFQIIEYVKNLREKGGKWNNLNHFHDIPRKLIQDKCKKILEKTQDNKIYQFAVPKMEPIRIIGFISNNIFYFVALDFKHEMYPMS